MDSPEMHRYREIEGFAALADDSAQRSTGIFAEEREGRLYTMTSLVPREQHGSLVWATMCVMQLGAKMLKLGLMIFDKLDSIDAHLLEQTMRERAKEGQ